MISCGLCSTSASAFWNASLLESRNFKTVPSLGALVEGWLLLVPKQHILCFGAMNDALTTEFEELKHKSASLVSAQYGDICIFEHGPSAVHKAVGCGVDHAH